MKPSTKTTVVSKTEPQTEAALPEAVEQTATPAEETEKSSVVLDETSSEEPTQAVATEEVVEEEPAPKAEPIAAQESAPAEPEKSGGPEAVMMGVVPATLRRMPLETVKKALQDSLLERVEILRSDRATRDLQDRMRASDGRCAPVIFTFNPDDKTVPPALFSGIESIAAAINLELPEVSVLLVANADASNAQGYVNAMQRQKPASHEDDFLQRVHSFYD